MTIIIYVSLAKVSPCFSNKNPADCEQKNMFIKVLWSLERHRRHRYWSCNTFLAGALSIFEIPIGSSPIGTTHHYTTNKPPMGSGKCIQGEATVPNLLSGQPAEDWYNVDVKYIRTDGAYHTNIMIIVMIIIMIIIIAIVSITYIYYIVS